jgi:uncharacterized coiled-coil protein SlyX
MELITRDLKDILYDIKQLSAALCQDKRDIDKALNPMLSFPDKEDHIEYLEDSILEARSTIDLRSDQLNDIEKYLVKLMEDLEYAVLFERVQQK